MAEPITEEEYKEFEAWLETADLTPEEKQNLRNMVLAARGTVVA